MVVISICAITRTHISDVSNCWQCVLILKTQAITCLFACHRLVIQADRQEKIVVVSVARFVSKSYLFICFNTEILKRATIQSIQITLPKRSNCKHFKAPSSNTKTALSRSDFYHFHRAEELCHLSLCCLMTFSPNKGI